MIKFDHFLSLCGKIFGKNEGFENVWSLKNYVSSGHVSLFRLCLYKIVPLVYNTLIVCGIVKLLEPDSLVNLNDRQIF